MKSMLLIVLFLFFAGILVSAQSADNQVIEGQNGLSLEIETLMIVDDVNGRSPEAEIFFIVMGYLRNDGDSQCVRARRVRLAIDDEPYAPQNPLMSDIQAWLEESRDFIGVAVGQCVEANTSEPTFIAFDVPDGFDEFTLSFMETSLTLSISDFADQDKLVIDGNIDLEAPTADDASRIQGFVQRDNTNAYSCAATACGVVRVVDSDETLSILETEAGWYLIEFSDGETAYIRSSLIQLSD
jgi:hypothetical protein